MCSRASGLFCACLLFSCVVHHCQCSDDHDHHHHHEHNQGDSQVDNEKNHNHLFVYKLFQIFGHNGVLNYKDFETMIQTLGISLNTSFDIFHSKKCPFVPVSNSISEDLKESQNTTTTSTKLRSEDSFTTEKSLSRALESKTPVDDVEISNLNESSTIEGSQCFSTHELLRAHNLSLLDDVLTPSDFYQLCPALIYHITHDTCAKENSHHFGTEVQYEEESLLKIWLYTAISVVTISMCGLLCVAIIPLIQKLCYQSLLQFLVALAVGSLSGDALLHLLPHVMVLSPESHHHDETVEGHNTVVIWRGFTALIGIYFFYSTERLLNHVTRFRKMKRNAKVLQMPKIARSLTNVDGEQSRMVGEKLSHHKHGSYGYKFDPANDGLECKESLNGCDSLLEEKKPLPAADNSTDQSKSQSDIDSERSEAKDSETTIDNKPTSSPMKPLHVDVTYLPPEKQQDPETPTEEFHRETVVYRQHNHDHSYVVTLTDHHHTSHHHHGHSHELPNTVSSVALMVVLGDGLHNFCDGLAIGSAFGSGIAGGISTSIAVLCHELPHELGDFAMLLKSGMSIKQAVLYNSISSVLCFIGSIIGVFLGNIPTLTNYISAFASGMFLYIALVSMLPELLAVSEHTVADSCQNLLLLFFGLTMGTTIMLLIALYEHDLHHLVS